MAVSTFNGEFESEFPVPLSGTRKGKGFNFTLGSGSAQVTLESFQGPIQLLRPGSAKDKDGGKGMIRMTMTRQMSALVLQYEGARFERP